jgi:phosphatidylinositol alpha-mannosyltransferase
MTRQVHAGIDRRLRIALFHTRLPEAGRKVGGVEIAVHRLANALADLDKDEVTVVSSTPAPSDARYRCEPFLPEWPFIHRRLISKITFVPLALNFFDFGRFDIVHLHGDDWFFFRRPMPTVRTFHGSALREAQHATTFRRRTLMYGIYGLERLSAQICRMPLAIGRDAAAIYGVKNSVSNGVDEKVFYPGPKHPRPRVLFVGLWGGRKRGQFVYETFLRDVLPRVPDAELCMVSDYCPPHPSVIVEAFPQDDALAQRFRESWVFVSASTYEGFGIPYVEALASGTAVVATPNSGAEEVLDGGQYGILADDASFGAAIVDLLVNRRRRGDLVVKGLERSQRYAWHRVASHHRHLYLEALGERDIGLDVVEALP